MKTTTVPAILVALVLAAAGCGGTDAITEQAVEDATDGEVKIDRDGDQTKIEVGGQELEARNGGLVDGFPADFPMPDGFEVEASSKTQGKYQAFGSIPSSDEAYSFYRSELSRNGWQIELSQQTGTGFQVTANNGGRQAVVNSSPANDGANLTVVVG